MFQEINTVARVEGQKRTGITSEPPYISQDFNTGALYSTTLFTVPHRADPP